MTAPWGRGVLRQRKTKIDRRLIQNPAYGPVVFYKNQPRTQCFYCVRGFLLLWFAAKSNAYNRFSTSNKITPGSPKIAAVPAVRAFSGRVIPVKGPSNATAPSPARPQTAPLKIPNNGRRRQAAARAVTSRHKTPAAIMDAGMCRSPSVPAKLPGSGTLRRHAHKWCVQWQSCPAPVQMRLRSGAAAARMCGMPGGCFHAGGVQLWQAFFA